MKLSLASTLLLAAACQAAPAKLGLAFDKRADALPTLTLPYATYRAADYNPNGDVSTAWPVSLMAVPLTGLS